MIMIMKLNRSISLFFLLLFAVLLTGCTLPFSKTKQAALQVNCEPKATVFLNDNNVGQTPYFDEKLKPGEYTLKIVPDTADGSKYLSWQGIVKLNSGIMTVVSRTLAESDDRSSGYVLSLEPTSEKEKAKISVISTPDSVVVNLDSEPKGFTPLALDDVSEGDRLITISSPGFKDETIKAKAVKGYKLMINVQLAKKAEENLSTDSEEATGSAEPSPRASVKSSPKPSVKPTSSVKPSSDKEATGSAEMAKPYVEIKDTPTGYLKVRSEPSTSGKEETVITKVLPGEVYKYIEANESGWYKIEYQKGKQGWISAQYATLVK